MCTKDELPKSGYRLVGVPEGYLGEYVGPFETVGKDLPAFAPAAPRDDPDRMVTVKLSPESARNIEIAKLMNGPFWPERPDEFPAPVAYAQALIDTHEKLYGEYKDPPVARPVNASVCWATGVAGRGPHRDPLERSPEPQREPDSLSQRVARWITKLFTTKSQREGWMDD